VFRQEGGQNEAGDQADVLEEGVCGGEPGLTLQVPEVVGAYAGDGCEDAECARAQPDEPASDDQRGAEELDRDGDRRPQDAGVEAEVLLLGDGGLEVQKLDHAAEDVGPGQQDPRGEPGPAPVEDGGHPAGIARRHLRPPNRRSRGRPRKP